MTEATSVEAKLSRYERYVEEISEDITNTVDEFGWPIRPLILRQASSSLEHRRGRADPRDIAHHRVQACVYSTKG
ncbi:hypothetical protein [Rhizobium sp. LjRoot254]|uniref:hypothetical protein n=1 Tax=Rhizobium sp. LjRoot254 TaxID=3342297 RepID=UPI003ED0D6E4